MATTVLRGQHNFDEYLFRLADGSIPLIDLDSAPSSLSCTHNYMPTFYGFPCNHVNTISSSMSIGSRIEFISSGWANVTVDGNLGVVYHFINVNLELMPSVRWQGKWGCSIRHRDYLYGAGITAYVEKSCSYGSISPRGNYSITGYSLYNPNYSTNYMITGGSQILVG